MSHLEVLNIAPKDSKKFVVDVVVKTNHIRTHLSRLTLSRTGLYDVPQTYGSLKGAIDVHTSYHPDGTMHEKMGRGELHHWPGDILLGQAKPHTDFPEFVVWERQGQPWASLKGIEVVGSRPNSDPLFVHGGTSASGYPPYQNQATDADHIFLLDNDAFPQTMVSLQIFLVEPDNIRAVEHVIATNLDAPRLLLRPLSLDKATVYTTRKPWLAIVSFRSNPSE